MEDIIFEKLLARVAEVVGSEAPKDIAIVLGISEQAVYKSLKNKKIPNSWIYRLSANLGIQQSWIIDGVGPMQPNAHIRSVVSDIACADANNPSRPAALEARIVELEAKYAVLETENAALKEVLRAKEETLAAFRQLLRQAQGAPADREKG